MQVTKEMNLESKTESLDFNNAERNSHITTHLQYATNKKNQEKINDVAQSS
jgi:hypothetical protein